MALVSPRLGAKATISLGRRGEAPSLYPAVQVSAAEMQPVPGRNFLQRVAEFVYVAINRTTGEEYLARKVHALNFALDRDQSNFVEILDGTPDAPKSWQQVVKEQSEDALAFAMNRGSASESEISLEEIAASEAIAETA